MVPVTINFKPETQVTQTHNAYLGAGAGIDLLDINLDLDYIDDHGHHVEMITVLTEIDGRVNF